MQNQLSTAIGTMADWLADRQAHAAISATDSLRLVMTSITITDWLLITVTLLSPVIAVQVQKLIEVASARRNAKNRIFLTLMATRATRLAPEHVQALNMIEIEFSGSWRGPTTRERGVINRWRIYADHLDTDVSKLTEAALVAWGVKRQELFLDLMEALSRACGYKFDRVQLKRGAYYPQAHEDADSRRLEFEEAVLQVLGGKTALAMKVVPADEDALAQQKRLQEALMAMFEGGALRVRPVETGNNTRHDTPRPDNDDAHPALRKPA